MTFFKKITIKSIGNEFDGYLSFFESGKDIPFEIKRIYYSYGPINIKRGMHAHKELQQLLWCPHGEIEIILDNGKRKECVLLDSPNKMLYISKGVWRDIYWKSSGAVLCAAASEYYNEDDYIRDYDEFLTYANRGYWKHEN